MSFETPVHNSHNSSFFSQVDDTFLNTRKRLSLQQQEKQRDNEQRQHQTSERQPSSFNLASSVTPYTPIKSLVASPFKPAYSQQFLSSTPLGNINGSDLPSSFISSNLSENHKHNGSHINIDNDNNNNNNNNHNNNNNNHNHNGSSSLLKQKLNQHISLTSNNENLEAKRLQAPLISSIYSSSAFKSRRLNSSTDLQKLRQPYSKFQETLSPAISNENHNIKNDLNDPHIAEALTRIVNKEFEVRKLLLNLFLILIYKFLKSIIELIILTNSKYLNEYFHYLPYMNYFIYFVLSYNLLTSSYKLIKPVDKCLDLPLNNQQRKVLGLSLLEDENMDEDEFQFNINNKNKNVENDEPRVVVKPLVSGVSGLKDVVGALNGLNINKPGSNKFYKNIAALPNSASSPEQIKEKLILNRKQLGFGNGDFKKLNGKFIYDLNNDSSFRNGDINSSFY